MPMKIEVDRDLCEANAICQRVAPEVFKVDDTDAAARARRSSWSRSSARRAAYCQVQIRCVSQTDCSVISSQARAVPVHSSKAQKQPS